MDTVRNTDGGKKLIEAVWEDCKKSKTNAN
jgi:hypothetical protein